MKVRDLMTANVTRVSATDSLVNVARLMQQNDIGSVPVCDGDKLRGIITDRDIVIRAIATGKDPNTVTAKDVMSTQLVTVTPDTDAHEAADLMARNQIRRLPVVNEGKLVGMLALGDMAVENIHMDEAGHALSQISHGVH